MQSKLHNHWQTIVNSFPVVYNLMITYDKIWFVCIKCFPKIMFQATLCYGMNTIKAILSPLDTGYSSRQPGNTLLHPKNAPWALAPRKHSFAPRKHTLAPRKRLQTPRKHYLEPTKHQMARPKHSLAPKNTSCPREKPWVSFELFFL